MTLGDNNSRRTTVIMCRSIESGLRCGERTIVRRLDVGSGAIRVLNRGCCSFVFRVGRPDGGARGCASRCRFASTLGSFKRGERAALGPIGCISGVGLTFVPGSTLGAGDRAFHG